MFSAVEIEINHSCNRKCSYCPNSILERKTQGEIEPEILTKLLRELGELGFSGRISYDFYNEPTLHSDFEGVVAKTRHFLKDASIEIYTNGTRLSAERFRRLLRAGASRFIVTKHESDSHHLFAEVFESLTEEERQLVTYRPYSDLSLTNRGGSLKHLGENGLPLTPCFIPEFIVTVTVGGNVLPCFEDFHEIQAMGNLRDRTLIEIWNSEKYVSFRRDLRRGLRHLHEPCRSCNRREVLQSAN